MKRMLGFLILSVVFGGFFMIVAASVGSFGNASIIICLAAATTALIVGALHLVVK